VYVCVVCYFLSEMIPALNVVCDNVSVAGNRAFAASGPQLWNSLHKHSSTLHQLDLTLNSFYHILKEYLFVLGVSA